MPPSGPIMGGTTTVPYLFELDLDGAGACYSPSSRIPTPLGRATAT
jgi:hypothetical protein